MDSISHAFARVLSLLMPASGRHRAGGGRHRAAEPAGGDAARRLPVARPDRFPAPLPPPGLPRHRSPYAAAGPEPPPPEPGGPTRPYVTDSELRLQRQRRRAAVLATYGIDVGPRQIHGVTIGGGER